MPSPRRPRITGTRATSHTDERAGQRRTTGPGGGDHVYLGIIPGEDMKVHLTVHEIVRYGVISRRCGDPKATVAEVVQAINDLQLDHYAVRDDGQLIYDPTPIRLALSTMEPRPGQKNRKAAK